MMKVITVIENIVLASFTLLSVIIAILAVIFRYVLKSALSWPEEITGFFLIGITVFGSSLAFKNKQHATVDLLSHFISEKANNWLSLGALLVSLFISLMVTIQSINMVIDFYRTEQYCTALEYLPLWFPMVLFPMGFVFISLRCLELLLGMVKGETV